MSVEIDKPAVFRRSIAGLFSLAVAITTGGLCLFMLIVAGIVLAGEQPGVGALLLATAAVMIILFRYVLRDALGKLGWRIGLSAATLDLALPADRSLIHHHEPVRQTLRLDEIERLDTRLEAYRSFGMVSMQRSYALMLKTGDRIVLGEDRAQGTGLAGVFLEGVTRRIVETGKLEMRDLGMAVGKGGVLAVLFTAPPPWDAADLDATAQQALWRRAGMTGLLASGASLVVLLAAIASNFF